jgi:UDP-glucuronate 4-epimerase
VTKVRVLVTGSAGFIGSELTIHLLNQGYQVVGIDNHNDYYDQALKEARLARHFSHPNYTHLRLDLADKIAIDAAFEKYKPKRVVNLAAQAGVRYSIDNPMSYIESNIVGFAHILEACRSHGVEHLVYASSSSVYGANEATPFSVKQNVDHPVSLYAASKKANELMAHAYSHLYGLPTTGLRFFTVYGPWGRPDMALFKFTKAILNGETIQLFNYGKHRRDFTYIDDVVEGIGCVLKKIPSPDLGWTGQDPDPSSSLAPWRIYNLGHGCPVELIDFVAVLENLLGLKAKIDCQPLQSGDVLETYADIGSLISDFSYRPITTIETGVKKFVDWYHLYYK